MKYIKRYWVIVFFAFSCIPSNSFTHLRKYQNVVYQPIAQLSHQQQAILQEKKQIESREKHRETQLKQIISLYANRKRESNIYTYTNRYKNRMSKESSLKIAQDIFQDQIADRQRFSILNQEIQQ